MKFSFLFLFSAWLCCSAHAQTQLWGMTPSGGLLSTGAIIKTDASGNNETVVECNPVQIEGANPFYTTLLLANDGKFYGVTGNGGAYNYGMLFQYDPATSTYVKKFDFNGNTNGGFPYGSLMQASDGMIYGTTHSGGAFGRGIIFQFDPVTSSFVNKFDFDGNAHGAYPHGKLVQAPNGKLYGLTFQGGVNLNNGVIFEFDIVTSVCTKRFDFNGAATGRNPYGSLMVASNGKLYGMTHFGGTNDMGAIFSFDPSTFSYTNLMSFTGAANGSIPCGSLMQASNGKLYGLTQEGGVNNKGVLFQYDPVSFVYVKLFDFDGTPNGGAPLGDLMQAGNGKLYGMTDEGGATYQGILFQYDIGTSTFTKYVDFAGATNGEGPLGSLVQGPNGSLYGLTGRGGLYNNKGVLFQFDPVTTIYTKLLDFQGPDPSGVSTPYGSLLQIGDGNLWGMCFNGGINDAGVIFKFNPFTSSYINRYDFLGTTPSGSDPSGNLILASDGNFYGMTQHGGFWNLGTLFQYDPDSGILRTKISFNGASLGSVPYGSLVQATDGKLYGMTYSGGVNGFGILFQYDPITNVFIKKLDFAGTTTGSRPYGTMIQATDGMLYGITSQGGTNGDGVIFQFDPVTSSYTVRFNFTWLTTGSASHSSLLQASNGKLYGLTAGGGSNSGGTLFEFDPVSSAFSVGVNFNTATSGSGSSCTLMQAIDGNLYGVTASGGVDGYGTIFKYDPVTTTFTKTLDFNGNNGQYPAYSKFVEVDAGPNIFVSSINPHICVGQTMNVPFTCVGTYNPGNIFTAQLSDAGGSFASPLNIGSLTSTTGGTISWVSPSNFPPGTNYKVRVVSTNPVVVGTPNAGSVGIYSWPVLTSSANFSSICSYSTSMDTLTVSGATMYAWSPVISNNDTIIVHPSSTTTYTVIGTVVGGCSDTATFPVVVHLPPVITATTTTPSYCIGNTLIITGNGGVSYSWMPGSLSGTTISPSPISNTTYTVIGTDSFGCIDTSNISISVHPPGPVAVSGSSNTAGCAVNNGSLSASFSGGTGPFTYTWYPGNINALTNANIASGTYTFVVRDVYTCVDSLTLTLTDSCAYVWPGDANEDGVADNTDVLAIGIANGATGSTRVAATTTWIGQPSIDWGQNFLSGTDYKYADCDGDGIIQVIDTTAVVQNFGLTHTFRTGGIPIYNATLPDLSIDINQTVIPANSAGTITVSLGTSSIPVSNCYGLAFTLNFDPTQIDASTFRMNEMGSWMGIQGTDLIGVVLNNGIGTGNVQIGITRTDHLNSNGFGPIANLSFMTTNAMNGTGTTDTVLFSISNVLVIASNEAPQTVNTVNDSVVVIDPSFLNIGSIDPRGGIQLFPNPFEESATLLLPAGISGKQNTLTLTDATGRIVRTMNISGSSTVQLQRNDLVDGLYFCTIRSEGSMVGMIKLILN